MANAAAGTVWNDLNYLGQIFTASKLNTPILDMIGGLNGLMETSNFEFPTSQTYDHETASQPAITETASLTAPTAITYVRTQNKNVTQIFQEQVSLSYARLSNVNRLSGISTTGQSAVITDELDWQISRALEKIARDVEYTIIQGTYQIAVNSGVANKTRGMNEAASTTTAAGGATLSKTLIQAQLKAMYDAGAVFQNPVFVVNAFQKQQISNIYAYAPMDRNIGGVNIKQVETDFGNIGVLLNPFQSTSVLGIYDMAFVKLVSQPVPGKGHLFYETLSKTGAGESGQIFGQLGLDHAAGFLHGTITGLATA